MIKVLLKQPGKKELRSYNKHVAKIARTAVSERIKKVPSLEMYSKQELQLIGRKNKVIVE